MTQDNINKAAEIALSSNYVMEDNNDAFRQGFHIGVDWQRDNLWHDPDEVPEIEHEIMWENEHFHGKYLGASEWKAKVDCFGRKERWCYVADILPSNKSASYRPFSRVDYSSGYDDATRKAIDQASEWLESKLPKMLNNNWERDKFIEAFVDAMEDVL